MKSRAVVAGVVVAAIAVAALLLFWPRSTSDEGSEMDDPPVGKNVPPAGGQGSVARDEPAAPAGKAGGEERAGDGSGAVDGGGVPVRDHRGELPTHPRTRPLPGDRPRYVVDRPVIADLRQALRPQIKRCSDEFGQGLAEDALIQAALQVTVRSGAVSVLAVDIEHRGVPEKSGLIDCARKAFAAVEVKAEGHKDVERHVLRLPFKVPIK